LISIRPGPKTVAAATPSTLVRVPDVRATAAIVKPLPKRAPCVPSSKGKLAVKDAVLPSLLTVTLPRGLVTGVFCWLM
jgi:hypothetical protein